MSDDIFRRIGVLSDSNVTGDLEIRLAEWREKDAYTRLFREVLPQDRFIPGERSEFVSDLDFREWSVANMDGGIRTTTRWDPEDGRLSRMQSWYIGERDFPRVGPNIEQTENAGGADFNEGRWLAIMYGDLYGRADGNIVKWDTVNEYFNESAGIATGSTNRSIGIVAVGDDVYMAEGGGTVRKISDFLGSPTNASHVTSGTWPVGGGMNPITAFQGRLFGLNGNDLYEIDLSTVNTLTKVSDIGGGTNWRDQSNIDSSAASENEDLLSLALATSDKGPIWWVVNDTDGFTDVWEYNVAADTTTRIGRLPNRGGNPHQIAYGFGFVFVTFFDPRQRGFVWYKRAGIEGVVGPLPSTNLVPQPKQVRGDTPILIAGFIGSDMILVHVGDIFAYNISSGAFSHMGKTTSHNPINDGTPATNAIVFNTDVFVGNAGSADGEVARTVFADINDTTTNADPILQTGRWHLGYPNTYKTITEIAVFVGSENDGSTHSGAEFTVRARMDNAAGFTDIGTIDHTELNVFKAFETSLRGFELEVQIEYTGAASDHTIGDFFDLEQIRARGITAEARREWQIVVDASNGSSAGAQLADHELLSRLDDFKQSGAIVSFTNPWDARSASGPITYSRCRVSSVSAPYVSESDSDQREIVIGVREVDVVGRDVVT